METKKLNKRLQDIGKDSNEEKMKLQSILKLNNKKEQEEKILRCSLFIGLCNVIKNLDNLIKGRPEKIMKQGIASKMYILTKFFDHALAVVDEVNSNNVSFVSRDCNDTLDLIYIEFTPYVNFFITEDNKLQKRFQHLKKYEIIKDLMLSTIALKVEEFIRDEL